MRTVPSPHTASFCAVLLLTPGLVAAQIGTAAEGEARKQARAVSVPEQAIQFDGRLDDLAWQGARRPLPISCKRAR